MMKNNQLFQPMKMEGKIEKLTINIALMCENDNYCEPKNFTQIDNYYEPDVVSHKK